uniref:Uncharacterized protein n=1 Tax=Pararge aegeria TaxID=116150 RepID=S4PXL3_9NEOP
MSSRSKFNLCALRCALTPKYCFTIAKLSYIYFYGHTFQNFSMLIGSFPFNSVNSHQHIWGLSYTTHHYNITLLVQKCAI